MKFSELNIIEPILKAVDEVGYTEPTPIQEQAIPPVLEGRDVLGCAQTGTGKTAAFAIPILQRLGMPREKQTGKRPIRALILTPTRELALQIFENCVEYGKYTGHTSAVIFGGVSQVPQVDQLRRGVDILIATPGRLWDLMGQKHIALGGVECFVLDEADRMLDMGFFPDVKRIIRFLPEKRQTLLFSATMPSEIRHLADGLLDNPVHIAVTPESTPVEAIHQCVYMVDRCNKRALLAHVIKEKGTEQTLVFTRTKHGADRVAKELKKVGISADSIHGDKSQGARQRALADFKEGKVTVLVATDIAARGIDITGLPYVINFDLPEISETYVHRIGRTGRAGLEGTAISFCDGAQMSYLIDIEELTGRRIDEVESHPYPMTGEQPTEPEPKPEQRRRNSSGSSNGRGGNGGGSGGGNRGGGDRRPRKDAPRNEEKKPPQLKKPQSDVKEQPEQAKQPQQENTRVPKAATVQPVRTEEKKISQAPVEQKTEKPVRQNRGRPAGGGRGGRRVIDNDSAQAETKPMPAREIPPSIRARIAAKVASVLGGKPMETEKPAPAPIAEAGETGDAPKKRRSRGGRGRGNGGGSGKSDAPKAE